MKKLKHFKVLLTCALLVHLGSHAQNKNAEYANEMKRIFGKLDLNRVPHNILLDVGFDMIDVNNYDGTLKSNNYIDGGLYKELYTAIASSATKTSVKGIQSPLILNNLWSSYKKNILIIM